MAANTSPIFELVPIAPSVQILPADTTSKKTLKAGGTNGTRLDEIYVSSTDTASVVLNFYLNDGSTDFYIGDVTVAIGAGYTTVARANLMGTLAPLLGYFIIPASYTLKVAANSTITTAKVVDIVGQGGDY